VSDETSNAIEVTGTAQSPRTLPWAGNDEGPRSEEDAVSIARSRGVVIPDDIRFVFVRDEGFPFPSDTYAYYGGFQPYKRFAWSELYVHAEEDEWIPVKIRRSVLCSDEAIVAVIAHEMFELNALRNIFEERETIPGPEIIDMVKPGVPRNLHDRAWDAADKLVWTMREEKKC